MFRKRFIDGGEVASVRVYKGKRMKFRVYGFRRTVIAEKRSDHQLGNDLPGATTIDQARKSHAHKENRQLKSS